MHKGILLGAGFSYDLGMPLASEITDVFLGIFTEKNAKLFAENLSSNNPYRGSKQNRSINKEAIFKGIDIFVKSRNNKAENYEKLLSELQELDGTQSDKDSYDYLFEVFYGIIHEILTLYQIESYFQIYNKNLQWFSCLKNILSVKETWVFTLNHDLYMECLALDLNIPITYGDLEHISFPISNIEMENKINFTYSNRTTLTIKSPKFFKNTVGINLVKLHGGISELEYEDRKIICNPYLIKENSLKLMEDFKKINNMSYYHQGRREPSSGRDRTITNSNGKLDIIRRSMLTGGNKYSVTTNAKKGEEKLTIFDNTLKKLDELAIIGYGFNDRHINDRISNAMVINNNLKLQIVDPGNQPKPEFLRQFDYNNRIGRAICSAAQWMDYSSSKKWNQIQTVDLEKNRSYRQVIKKLVECIIQRRYSWC